MRPSLLRTLSLLSLALVATAARGEDFDLGWLKVATKTCADGAISTACKCGGTKYTDGYCTSGVWTPAQYYVSFSAASACSSSIAGTGITVTASRASHAWATLAGVETECVNNELRRVDFGILSEGAITQYVAAPDSPASEPTIAVTANGVGYYARAEGDRSVVIAVADTGPATASGLPCTVTSAATCTFTVSVGGNIKTTVSGTSGYFSIQSYNKPTSKLHAAIAKPTDSPRFTTPAGLSNAYCIGVRGKLPDAGASYLLGASGLLVMGDAASSSRLTVDTAGLVTYDAKDSSNASKTRAVHLTVAEMQDASVAGCRDAFGNITMWLGGRSVGVAGGTGSGIGGASPPATTYVGDGYTSMHYGPIAVKEAWVNPGSTAPSAYRLTDVQVAAFGDSITYGSWATTNYVSEVVKTLGSGYTAVNLGVGGLTTSQICGRVTGSPYYYKERRYPYAIVSGGTNDMNTGISAATAFANLQSCYSALAANGSKVIALTVLPFNASGDHETQRLALNVMILAECVAQGYTCADIATGMAKDGHPEQMADVYTDGQPDKMHPNDAGHREIAREILVTGAIP
jgi:lysophospholipase L1-like esterase